MAGAVDEQAVHGGRQPDHAQRATENRGTLCGHAIDPDKAAFRFGGIEPGGQFSRSVGGRQLGDDRPGCGCQCADGRLADGGSSTTSATRLYIVNGDASGW